MFVSQALFASGTPIGKSERLDSKSVTYAFEFRKNGEGIAHGRVTSVCCRTTRDHRMESIEIPASLRAILERAK